MKGSHGEGISNEAAAMVLRRNPNSLIDRFEFEFAVEG
jgi:hypothetical protein